MSWYAIVNRITLDDDALDYIIQKLVEKHPNDTKFAEAAKEIKERLLQEAHEVILD
jgi:hypothetical protein